MSNRMFFDSEGPLVDLVFFNLEGLGDTKIIAGCLLKYFTLHALIDDVPGIAFYDIIKL